MTFRPVSAKPVRGTIMAFKKSGSDELAGIPARVVQVWPRFRSGAYMVTLEYPRPVRLGKQLITHIEAFASELESAGSAPIAGWTPQPRHTPFALVRH